MNAIVLNVCGVLRSAGQRRAEGPTDKHRYGSQVCESPFPIRSIRVAVRVVLLSDLRDAAPEMLPDLRQFLELKVGIVAPGLEGLEIALGAFLNPGPNPAPQEALSLQDLKLILRDPDWSRTWISPVSGEDARHLRPYFMIPLLETAYLGEQRILRGEIKEYVQKVQVQIGTFKANRGTVEGSAPITDIFVISHGWHRNYFAAVGVYDRLLSRFGVLCARDRIEMSSTEVRPLFLAMHWHSDPGRNGWVDLGGRRHREDFIRNVRALFEVDQPGNEPELLTIFEEFFVRIAKLSTPDQKVEREVIDGAPATRPGPARSEEFSLEDLTKRLDQFRIRDVPPPPPGASLHLVHDSRGHKVATLWRCYVESQNKALLLDQDAKAFPVGAPWTAVATLARFVLGVVGVGAVLGIAKTPFFTELVEQVVTTCATFVIGSTTVSKGVPAVITLLCFSLVGVLVLYGCLLWRRRPRRDPNSQASASQLARDRLKEARKSSLPPKGLVRRIKWHIRLFNLYYLQPEDQTESAKTFPVLQAVAWAPLQIACLAPAVALLMTAWILRTVWAAWGLLLILGGYVAGGQWLPAWPLSTAPADVALASGWGLLAASLIVAIGSYKKETRLQGVFRERLEDEDDRAVNFWDQLAAMARFPINLARGSVARDSSFRDLLRPIDNILAFFEFQRKGVDAGRDAGRFLRRVLLETPELQQAKIHFIGHSFGGLVVCNAFRTLMLPKKWPAPPSPDGSPATSPKNSDPTEKSGASEMPKPAEYLKPPEAYTADLGNVSWIRKRRRKKSDPLRILQRALDPGTDEVLEVEALKIRSLTLIQGALAANWFASDAPLMQKVKEREKKITIATIYSKYDTANGFYYPLTNSGRLAAGHVGFTNVAPKDTLGKGGVFAMINALPTTVLQAEGPFLNLDASRLIYEGATATGGGHDDIFKDDVVHLIWAISRR